MSVDRERGVAIVNEALGPLEGDTVFGQRWGNGDLIRITTKELSALHEGKMLAVDVEGEFVVYLQLDEESED
ncbi:hypothetical protein RU820_06340 [Acidithiobacillus ferrooxidans]|uniref:Uncharacterized protein n=1 Tax=Acidithiobacillus ferrooxidans (strain ATCC 23270 / DSM 14882 / CIP 104768 / NCIMB 8455) TaxID=243159 RepID=B7J9I4_ACIF2|nr:MULTISPECIES: hypothetical protein [Acidithiobacillus]ACK78647.1 hypothetical protein AFE_1382 [Acidithiobacillus ferrooxidans ATCC 23270]MBN6745120.1 hypothetical protein [Acidithiobacillus sp. MC2.2]MBN6747558.1 hypothetical protein [Acidithiobacillus sp. PG05]